MRDRFVLLTIIVLVSILLALLHILIPINKLFIVMFLLVLYTMWISASFNHQRRRYKKRPERLNYNYQPSISVMIPAHNEENVIASTVENILNIDYENFEILIIDDRSEDNTSVVIKNLEQKYNGKVRTLIRDKDAYPGKSAVLNDGLKLCNNDVICVFDADAKVKRDFFKNLLPYLAPEDVGAVQARKIISNKDVNILTRCQNNEYTLDNHFQLSRDSVDGAVELRGNGFLVKKVALEEVGGWNNNTITDDLDLSTKLHLNAWAVRFSPVGEVFEEGITKIIPLIKQRRRWVEGSIRRYLDYFFEIITSDVISLRASFDMLAYLLEFIVPVICIAQIIHQTFYYAKGMENHLLGTLALLFGIGVFFFCGIIYSLKNYDKLSWPNAIKQSLETSIYMMVVWLPLVIWILFKIMIFKRDMNWGKTSHGLTQESQDAEEAILIE